MRKPNPALLPDAESEISDLEGVAIGTIALFMLAILIGLLAAWCCCAGAWNKITKRKETQNAS